MVDYKIHSSYSRLYSLKLVANLEMLVYQFQMDLIHVAMNRK
ncbi:MAG: hypothetical protein RSB96_01380 [Oscillospiraceae bacterium]